MKTREWLFKIIFCSVLILGFLNDVRAEISRGDYVLVPNSEGVPRSQLARVVAITDHTIIVKWHEKDHEKIDEFNALFVEPLSYSPEAASSASIAKTSNKAIGSTVRLRRDSLVSKNHLSQISSNVLNKLSVHYPKPPALPNDFHSQSVYQNISYLRSEIRNGLENGITYEDLIDKHRTLYLYSKLISGAYGSYYAYYFSKIENALREELISAKNQDARQISSRRIKEINTELSNPQIPAPQTPTPHAVGAY